MWLAPFNTVAVGFQLRHIITHSSSFYCSYHVHNAEKYSNRAVTKICLNNFTHYKSYKKYFCTVFLKVNCGSCLRISTLDGTLTTLEKMPVTPKCAVLMSRGTLLCAKHTSFLVFVAIYICFICIYIYIILLGFN